MQNLTAAICLNVKLTCEQVASLAPLNSVTLIINSKLNSHPTWQNMYIHMPLAKDFAVSPLAFIGVCFAVVHVKRKVHRGNLSCKGIIHGFYYAVQSGFLCLG